MLIAEFDKIMEPISNRWQNFDISLVLVDWFEMFQNTNPDHLRNAVAQYLRHTEDVVPVPAKIKSCLPPKLFKSRHWPEGQSTKNRTDYFLKVLNQGTMEERVELAKFSTIYRSMDDHARPIAEKWLRNEKAKPEPLKDALTEFFKEKK